MNYYNDIESTLSEVSLEEARLDPDQSNFSGSLTEDQRNGVKSHIKTLHEQYGILAARLRQALMEWAGAAQ